MADDPLEQPPERIPSLMSMAVRHGDLKVRAVGLERRFSLDIYHRLMGTSWTRLGVLFVGLFLGFNLLFAGLYRFDQGGLATAHDPMVMPLFWKDFFFSVHTVATIGYGNVYPVSLFTNAVVVIEITLGLIYFALSTGIAFARFSRPTARFLFSHRALIRDVDGVPTLMLRTANQRHNVVYSAQARLTLLLDSDVGGVRMRRFIDLPLVRDSNPIFALTWTIMHAIKPDGPLRCWLHGEDASLGQEIIVIVSGIDEISGQVIHDRWAYVPKDVHRNSRFTDIITAASDGTRTIDYSRFHDVVPD
jgi:inward rectifier potassium channel